MLDSILFALTSLGVSAAGYQADTVRVEVGSEAVDGGVYAPHAARVSVRIGSADGPLVAQWTNELTLGDSAGRRVMRWLTKGTRKMPNGSEVTWELAQTYDAKSLAPRGYRSSASNGSLSRFAIDQNRVKGSRRGPTDSTDAPVEYVLERPGFFAGASDLVPVAVGLRPNTVIIAPLWTPNQQSSELRTFAILSQDPINVEGQSVQAWKVEERKYPDGALVATWYLTNESPYMVYGVVPLPDGRVQYMSEVPIPVTAGRK